MVQRSGEPNQVGTWNPLVNQQIAGLKMDRLQWVDVFPTENGDIPASYVGSSKGIPLTTRFYTSIINMISSVII